MSDTCEAGLAIFANGEEECGITNIGDSAIAFFKNKPETIDGSRIIFDIGKRKEGIFVRFTLHTDSKDYTFTVYPQISWLRLFTSSGMVNITDNDHQPLGRFNIPPDTLRAKLSKIPECRDFVEGVFE
jgi:hypothetical protein